MTDPRSLADILRLLAGDELPLAEREALRAAAKAAQRPTITWSSPRPGQHFIDGYRLDSDLLGLRAAHLAFMHPRQSIVRAADMAAPGARHADDVVRRALTVAVDYLDRVDMPRAADALRQVKVRRGFVVYLPRGWFDIQAS